MEVRTTSVTGQLVSLSIDTFNDKEFNIDELNQSPYREISVKLLKSLSVQFESILGYVLFEFNII